MLKSNQNSSHIIIMFWLHDMKVISSNQQLKSWNPSNWLVAEFVCWYLVHEVDLPQSPSIAHSLLLCRGVHPVCPEHRRHGRGVVDQVRHGWWRPTCICGTLTADYNVSHYCRNNSNNTSFSLLQSITFKFYSKNNQWFVTRRNDTGRTFVIWLIEELWFSQELHFTGKAQGGTFPQQRSSL